MFSPEEKERRHRAVREVMAELGVEAILLVGDAGNGFGFSGDYRFYTDNRTITYREVAVAAAEREPVLFTTTTRKLPEIERRSFVNDCRFSDDLLEDVVKLLRERNVSGRVGVSFEMLSVAWYRRLVQAFPSVEWVEVHEKLMQVRSSHSDEEAAIFRTGGLLADGGYQAALDAIRPGVTEFEIVAAIEGFSRSRGAEEHFSLIGSGRFSFAEGTNLIFYYPTHRRLEVGDSVLMEITPRVEGYWTQVVRAVNVGKPNSDLERMQKVCRGAIEAGLEQFRPGRKVGEIVAAMEPYVSDSGYVLRGPYGHVSGVDLVEARVSPKSELVLTPGTSVTIHPTVFTKDERNWSFCGETYLVTGDGYERLNQAPDELVTV